jgi:hypothetical protein
MQQNAPTIYAYPGLDELLRDLPASAHKSLLPGAQGKPITERPATK